MIKIPEKLNWLQSNKGTRLGSIYASQGIDLTDNVGNLRVAPRLLLNTSSTDDADLGMPVAFRYYSGVWWTCAGSVMFKQTTGGGSVNEEFAQDATASTPTDCNQSRSDMEEFDGSLYVTRASADVSYYNGSWSSFTVTSSGSADTKMLCRYGTRLYMTYGSGSYRITSWDTSRTVPTMGNSYTCNLGTGNRITFMRAASNGIWIGTLSTSDQDKASIFFWNGVQTTPNAEYKLDSLGVLTGWVDSDILYAVDIDGSLLRFNGGGFTKVDKLPLPYDKYLFEPNDPDNSDRFIHPNGMTVRDGIVRVLVNGRVFNSSQSTLEQFPSGIWEWTAQTGFYHKQSPSYTPINSTTITDYGQIRLRQVGALVDAKSIEQNDSKGTLICGVRYHFDSTNNSRYGIFIDDNTETTQKYGSIILPEITSGSFTEMWRKIVPRFRKLLSASDSITVKHRVDKTDPTQITLFWSDTDTFDTSTDVSAMLGHEVLVLSGPGAGKSAHIASVSVSGGTYTVNLDDTFTGVTGSSVAHVNNWIKDGTYSSQYDNFSEFTLSEPSTIIQGKLCFQVTGEWDLYDVFLLNSTDKESQ